MPALRAIVYDSAFNQVALIPRILRASTREAVNQVGSFELTIPANDIDDTLLDYGRIIGLWHEPDGEILRGRIEHTTTSNVDDRPTITISCATLAIELVWQDTYFGVAAEAQTPAAVVTRILGDAEAAWTQQVSGGSLVNVTNEFAPASSFQTLLTLAEMQGAYVRETATVRELELTQNTTDSGIEIFNPAVAPTAESPTQGFIAGLPSLATDGSAVINRLVPLGLDAADLILDLGLSNRASPYTIQNFIADPPRVTNVTTLTQNAFNETDQRTELRLEIECTGINRGLLLFRVLDIPAAVVLPYTPTIDGREMISLEGMNTGGTGFQLVDMYYFADPKQGTNAIVAPFSDGGPADIKLIAVALAGVRQHISPIRDSVQATAGVGTNASATATSAADDLVIGFLMWTNGTAADSVNQTSLVQVGGAAPAAAAAKRIASGASTQMQWTLSVSQVWAVMAVSIMPALVYYIEDAASIAASGRRTGRLVMNANRFVGATSAQLQAAANTLYDRAVTKIMRAKDGITSYDVDILTLPDVPWLVGDSMRLIYTGLSNDGTYLNIDEVLPVLERRREFDLSGALKWQLRLANVYQHPASVVEMLYGSEARLGELETAI